MRNTTARMTTAGLALIGSFLVTGTLSAQGSQMGNDSSAMAGDKGSKGAMGDAMGKSAMAASLQGKFSGLNGRKAAGGYEVVTENGAQLLRLSEDFSVDEVADATVYLSANGAVDAQAVKLGRLPRTMGVAEFKIPAKTTLSSYHRVVIWSKQFGAALAEAPLGGSGGGMMRDNMGH